MSNPVRILKNPSQYKPGIEKIIELDSEVFELLLEALKRAQPSFHLESLASTVSSTLQKEGLSKAEVFDILNSVLSLSLFQSFYDLEPETFVKSIKNTVFYEESHSASYNEEQQNDFANRLTVLLNLEGSFKVATKVTDRLREGEQGSEFASEEIKLEAEFQKLVEEWREETGMLSLMSKKAIHPAYQRIIGLGKPAIPLLLRELEQKPDHWFWALRAITGENPVRSEDRGRLKQMAIAWLEWGKNAGYEW